MRRRAHAARPAEHSTQAGCARSVIAAQAIQQRLRAGWITVEGVASYGCRCVNAKMVGQISEAARQRESVANTVDLTRKRPLAGLPSEPIRFIAAASSRIARARERLRA